MANIKCGKCQGTHGSVAEVRECYAGSAQQQVATVSPAARMAEAASRTTIAQQVVAANRSIGRVSALEATPKQVDYLRSLLEERNVPVAQVEVLQGILGAPITKQQASAWITALKEHPRKAPVATSTGTGTDVPAGYYAVASRTGSNDLDFFRVSKGSGRWEGRTFVQRVIGGHPDVNVRNGEARDALAAILSAGVGESAARYGREIGRCGRCNRHLTDAESRARGLGPDCAGK